MSEYFNKLLAPDSMSISLKQDLLVSTGKIAVPDKNNIHLEVRTCEIVTEEGWSGTVSRQLHNGHWYIYRELVQFYYARFCTQTECHEWSAAPITACLRHRPLGCFHSECCVDGESMAAPRETSLHPHIYAEREDGKVAGTVLFSKSSVWPDWGSSSCSLQPLMVRAQPIVPIISFCNK